MFDAQNINRSIRTLIRTLLSMPNNSVRPADQIAPTGNPPDQWATVKIMAVSNVGIDISKQTDKAAPNPNKLLIEDIEGQRQITASINFYRGDALTKCERLTALLRSSYAADLMQSAGLGFIRHSPVRDLTAVIDTLPEPRAQIDLEFYIGICETLELPTFGTFPIDIETNHPPITHFEVNEP